MGDTDRAGSLDVIRLPAARPPATLNTASPRIPRRGEAFAVPRLRHDALVKCVICGRFGGRVWGSYGPTPACDPCHSDWVTQQRTALEAIPTCVYRLYDVFGRLLYVGMTSNIARRWKEHRTEHGWWWYQVTERRLDWFPTRDRAWRAERQAVRTELPLYNNEAWGEFGDGRARPELPPGVPPYPKLPVTEEKCLDETALRAYLLEVAVWRVQLQDAALNPQELAVLLKVRRAAGAY